MIRRGFMMLLVMTGCFAFAGGARAESDIDRYMREMTRTEYLIILGSSRDFCLMQRQARALSKKLNMPFSMQGMTFDPRRGLSYGGEGYFVRRDNEDYETGRRFLSIEESEGYPGLKAGYYIIVAGIYDTRGEAGKVARGYRKCVPDLMVRRTRIYYGCRS